MRTYNEFEKKIIRTIINSYQLDPQSYVLANAYYDILYESKCEYRNGGLFFYRKIDNVSSIEILELKQLIIRISLLLKYLIEKEYIYPIEDKNPDLTSFGDIFTKDGLYGIKLDIPGDISEMIEKSFCNIVILQPLFDLVDSDFKSVEEIHLEEAQKQTEAAQAQSEEAKKQTEAALAQSKEAKKQTIWSLIAFGLSMLSIALSIGVPIYVARNETVTMDTIQYKRWDSIKVSTDSRIEKIEQSLKERDSMLNDISNTLKTIEKRTIKKAAKK